MDKRSKKDKSYIVTCDSKGRVQRWYEYGNTAFRTNDGTLVRMYRRGQRCRFYTAGAGCEVLQVGPEQANVVPAIYFAFSSGWIDVNASPMANLVCRIEAHAAIAAALP